MALGNVFIKDVDGNIPYDTGSSGEKVTGLLFDVSLQPTLFTEGYGKTNETRLKPGDVCYITSFKSAVNDFGIIERVEATDEEEMNVNFLHGIPAYHIREFFRMSGNPGGSGKLYVMFADCSANWDALEIMQRAAGGMINQIGIWTEQPLWKANGASEQYNLNLVKGLNDVAVGLAEQNQPLSLILSANPSNTGADTTEGRQIDLNKIPSCICESSRISCIFGQAHHEKISTMQMCNRNHTPVGFLGAVMGAIAKANVHESIAWVKQFNLFADDFQEIELGFGDINLDEAEENFLSLNRYESLSPSLLDELDDKGYIFPIKYAGRENGIYISKDQTCSHGDFRTIARNRTINKSRRAVRAALLPYVNSPLMVNPSTGFLAPSKITAFKTLIGDILAKMQAAQEISGYAVTIDPNQNVLVDDTLRISYVLVPVGVAVKIYVEEGLSLTANKTWHMAIINNVAYSWSMITLSSTALGIDEGSTTLEGVSAIKWSKKRKVESNYGMGGRPVSRGFGNITYTASITMDYATQQLLRSVYGSLLEIGEFDLIISFANPMAGEDWTTTTVTLKGCIFTEDCLESQQDDTNITHEFDLNPFDIQIGSGDTI